MSASPCNRMTRCQGLGKDSHRGCLKGAWPDLRTEGSWVQLGRQPAAVSHTSMIGVSLSKNQWGWGGYLWMRINNKKCMVSFSKKREVLVRTTF